MFHLAKYHSHILFSVFLSDIMDSEVKHIEEYCLELKFHFKNCHLGVFIKGQ